MPISFPSALIRYKRLAKNWSQEGLCDGICAVSYLSKIEQGKAEPNPAILAALMGRLEIVWHAEAAEEAAQLVESLWEAILSLDEDRVAELRKKLADRRETYVNGPHMLDCLLLERLHWNIIPPETEEPALETFAQCFDLRQRVWYLMVQDRYEEAALLLPSAYAWHGSGANAYYKGDYTKAVEQLLRSCTLAAEEGRARVMMRARTLLGNCYSNLGDYNAMLMHYRAAERLARDLQETGFLESLAYNTAATQMQLGRYQEAYAYFASLKEPYAMALHKQAICLEKLGRTQEALEALERVPQAECDHADGHDYPGREWVERMCALVRYRLEHPGYLHEEVYGSMLLSLWQDIQLELPDGFAIFHRPWVEEWYVANRQYKQAWEMKRFS